MRPVSSNHRVTLGYREEADFDPNYLHRGIDYGCPAGTPVVATKGGTVVHAAHGGGYGSAYGTQVILRVDDVWVQYAHMSKSSVKVGQAVATGQQIGLSGDTGNTTGAHLHLQENTKPPGWVKRDSDGRIVQYAYQTDRAPQTVAYVEHPSPLQWDRWKLTLPIGKPEKPTEVKPTASRRPWYRREGDWLFFRAPVNGVTTKGSDYPRTELRELAPGGDDFAEWSNRVGTKTRQLSGTFKVTELPAVKPHGVVAQIHTDTDDLIEVRIEGKRIFVESDGDDLGTLDADYHLDREFALLVTVTPGNIRVRYTRPDGSTTYVDLEGTYTDLYWKAGAYAQAFAGQKVGRKRVPADSAFEVGIKELRIT